MGHSALPSLVDATFQPKFVELKITQRIEVNVYNLVEGDGESMMMRIMNFFMMAFFSSMPKICA